MADEPPQQDAGQRRPSPEELAQLQAQRQAQERAIRQQQAQGQRGEQEPSSQPQRRWELRVRDKINKLSFGALGSALTASTLGTTALLVPTSFTAGGIIGKTLKGEKSLGKILDEAITQYAAVNTVLYPMSALGDFVFPMINNADLAGKLLRSAVAVGPYNATFVGSYLTADYLYANQGDATGLGKYLKENVPPVTKQFGLVFAPGYSLSANGVTSIAGYPTFMYNAAPAAAISSYAPFKTKAEKRAAKGNDDNIEKAIADSGGDSRQKVPSGKYANTA